MSGRMRLRITIRKAGRRFAGAALLLMFALMIAPLHLLETGWRIVRQAVGPNLARAATTVIVVAAVGICVAGTLHTSMQQQLSDGGEVVLCGGGCGYLPMLDVLGPWPVALLVTAVSVGGYWIESRFRGQRL